MKPGVTKVSLPERVKLITEAIKLFKVCDAVTLSIALDLTDKYITRLLRHHVDGIKVYRLNKYDGRPTNLYYFNTLSEEKTDLINKNYRRNLFPEW